MKAFRECLIIFLVILDHGTAFSSTECNTGSLECLIKKISEPKGLTDEPLSCIEAPEPVKTYCEDFYTFACDGKSYQEGLKQFIPELSSILEKFARSACPLSKDCDVKVFDIPDTKEFPKNAAIGLFSAILGEEISSDPEAAKKLVGQTEQDVYGRIGLAENELRAVFEREKRRLLIQLKTLPLSQKKKDEITSRINGVRYANSVEAIDLTSAYLVSVTPDGSLQEANKLAYSVYNSTCGAAGMNEQSFTGPDTFIHICAGAIFNHARTYGKAVMLDLLARTISHELSHSLVEIEPETYEPLRECFQDKTGFPVFDNLSLIHRVRSWERQKTEIIADTWAAENIAGLIEEKKLSGETAARFLAQEMKPMCDQEKIQNSFGTHPSGPLRISIFARNPKIRALMNCSAPTQEAPYCSVSGRLPLKQ